MKTRYNSKSNKGRNGRNKNSETSIEDFEKRVAMFIKNAAYPMDEKRIAQELGLIGQEKDRLSKTLKLLENNGKIQKRHARYFSLEQDKIVVGKYEYSKGQGYVTTFDEGMKKILIDKKKTPFFMLDGDDVIVRLDEEVDESKHLYKGTVVGIQKRCKKEYVGTIKEIKGEFYIVPEDKKIGRYIKIAKKGNKLDAIVNQVAVVKVTVFPKNKQFAIGEIQKVLGDMDEAGMDMLALIEEYKLPNRFPEDVLQEAEKIPNEIDPSDMKNRVDLRNQVVYTIDGEDAKDLDDAVSVSRTDHDTYMLYVHIADVSHYVTEDSLLDREAVLRGTSVYMMDRVIPMLPKKLSNGICSLNAGKDRYTLSVSMEINKAGKVIKSKIYKAVINVNERMSYNLVTKILDESDEKVLERYKDYIDDFKLMAEIAKVLQRRREKDGSLNINSPEPKITLNEVGHAVDVQMYPIHFSNHIIEQFMLTANETVAETFNVLKAPFIYRVHEAPDKDKVMALNKTLWNLGYKIKLGTGDEVKAKPFNDVLAKVKGKKEEFVVSNMLLRSMKVATYEDYNTGHFGIASQCYCHFTSPIRRYPDLFIHRVISEYIANGYKLPDARKAKLLRSAEEFAKTSTDTSRRSQKVEWDSEDVKEAEYMADRIGEKYEGIVSSVTQVGVYVRLDNTIEGLVRYEDLGDDYFEYDEETRIVTGKKSKEVIKIGDDMQIKVKSADKLAREINFARV